MSPPSMVHHVKNGDSILGVWNRSTGDDIDDFLKDVLTRSSPGNVQLENSEVLKKNSHARSKFNIIVSNLIAPRVVEHTEELLATLLHILRPGGVCILFDETTDIATKLKLTGFINISREGPNIVCYKPNFEVGSSMKLGQKSVWKIDNSVESAWTVDNDDDIINSDDLLDESDKKKSTPAPPKVCGTTGMRKACADCSCGLAEELKGETKEQPKSSCGSCYLGDAFRCASCPYLGMPAFKPGEKVLLANLKPDL